MSAPPRARTRLQLAADAQAALAQAAAAAANAPAVQANAPGGAPEAQALALLVQAMARQELSAAAARAQAAADAAARAADAEASLAQQRRMAAGPAPLFQGKGSGLEAHRWLTTLEQWFAAAHIEEGDDATRLEVAQAALRDAAQAWWSTKLSNGTAAALGTWALFSAEVRARFLPLDVVRWAMREREALIASSATKGRNVLDYTAKFNELDQLLPDEAALSRVIAYERGLPGAYAVKCAERRFATLAEATEAMITLWHAKETARHTTASLSNVQVSEGGSEAAAAPSSGSSAPAPGQGTPDARLDRIEQLMAMMTERFSGAQRGRGGHTGGPSRSGGRSRQREGGPPRGERSRTPGLSDELVRARIRAGQCIKCGQEGHFKQECTNEAKLN
jgi:hypothetical protein